KEKERKGEFLLGEEDIAFLQAWAGQSGLDRLLILRREGKSLSIEAKGTAFSMSVPFSGGESEGILEQAWKGAVVSTPLQRDPERRYYRALFAPIQRPGQGIVALVGVVAPADFLGNISRLSSYIFYGFLVGIPAALLISLFFIDFVLRPYRRLSSATPSLSAKGDSSPDVEAIVSTYKRIIQSLREQELELARLYQVEQKRAQDLESYQRYLLSNISSGVISLDSGFRIQVCNEVARGILGLPESGVQGYDAREVFARMPELLSLLQESLGEGKIFRRRELRIEREGADSSWIGVSSSLLRDEAGVLGGAIFLLIDLTEIRGLQEQMRIKENLAALGEMSAGIAHEFRNSLSALLAQCRLLQRRLPEEEGGRKTLAEMVEEILALERVIQNFLKFARPQELKVQPLDLAEFLRELGASFAEPLAEARIKMIIGPGTDAFIQADPLALRQAIVNLIQNAQEAMPEGGELAISVQIQRKSQGWKRGKDLSREKGFARISVVDNGKGMDDEEKKKAFLPFFTTKEKGTGLGLALVQRAIVGMGGKIEVESELGKGCAFHLYLPLVPLTEGKGSG
ncbi:MAG TPA: ATP-binding protein, partial [Candidatus Methylomirabilis sp.]